jgi:hypothetical protein
MKPVEIQSLLEPFYGYLELEMDSDANDFLEELPNELKSHPLVYSARLDLLMAMARWEDGVILGQSLCKNWPKQNDFWFRTAYCQHELKKTAEAKETLLSAPTGLRDAPLYSYNLACYEAQLGNTFGWLFCSFCCRCRWRRRRLHVGHSNRSNDVFQRNVSLRGTINDTKMLSGILGHGDITLALCLSPLQRIQNNREK